MCQPDWPAKSSATQFGEVAWSCLNHRMKLNLDEQRTLSFVHTMTTNDLRVWFHLPAPGSQHACLQLKAAASLQGPTPFGKPRAGLLDSMLLRHV